MQIVRYRESGMHTVMPRLAWAAAMEAVTTSGALAVQVGCGRQITSPTC
jgi:hypothetical protein